MDDFHWVKLVFTGDKTNEISCYARKLVCPQRINWINLEKAPFLVFENREMAASFVKSDKTRMLRTQCSRQYSAALRTAAARSRYGVPHQNWHSMELKI